MSCAGEPAQIPDSLDVLEAVSALTVVPTLTVENRIEHVVSKGETLSHIARQYGSTVDELVQANNIENANVIWIGQVIVIPHGMGADSPVITYTPLPASTPTTSLPAPTMIADNPVSGGESPTRLVIPKINLDTPVVEVGWRITGQDGQQVRTWDVADFAAGWHRGSALPGAQGNIIISGHHNIKGEVFRYLVDLEVGDEISLFCGDRAFTYQVTEKNIVPEKGMSSSVRDTNALWLAKTAEEQLTMITCWPYTNNTHRLIIVAKPVRE